MKIMKVEHARIAFPVCAEKGRDTVTAHVEGGENGGGYP